MTVFRLKFNRMYIGEKLKAARNLTVLTNGLTTAAAMGGYEQIDMMLCGGTVYNSISTAGADTAEMTDGYRADVFLFSCRGVSDDGNLTDANDKSAYIKKLMLKNAKHKIL